MAKYVVEWYNSIGLFNKPAYIVPVNPIVIIFCHKQYRICPLKQNLFGWFTYRGFLTATCWNNRNVRVESVAGKTVHKLFVGGVHITYSPIGTKRHITHFRWQGFRMTCGMSKSEIWSTFSQGGFCGIESSMVFCFGICWYFVLHCIRTWQNVTYPVLNCFEQQHTSYCCIQLSAYIM